MSDTLARIDHALAVHDATPNYDGTWLPGDPLHDDTGVWARPMVSVLDDNLGGDRARCADCQVSWAGPEPCWACGTAVPTPTPAGTVSVEVTIDMSPITQAIEQMREAFARAARDLAPVLRRAAELVIQMDRDAQGPRPLCVDGHEYRRRTRSRRRRARR